MKTFGNILGAVGATLFSLVLVCVLLTIPVWQGVSGLLRPAALESVIEEIDLAEAIAAEPELIQALAESGMSEEAVQALLRCDAVEELLQSIAGDALKALRGELEHSSLTRDVLADLVAEHKDELIEVVKLMAPEGYTMSADQAALFIDQLLQAQGDLFIATINGAMLELQAEMVAQNVTQSMQMVANGAVTAALIIAALILAALVFVCRLHHMQGLVWLGVDAILAALPSLGIAAALMGSQLPQALALEGAAATAIGPLLHHAGVSTLIGAIILAVLGALCIAGFILLRDRRLKAEAAAAETPLPEVL